LWNVLENEHAKDGFPAGMRQADEIAEGPVAGLCEKLPLKLQPSRGSFKERENFYRLQGEVGRLSDAREQHVRAFNSVLHLKSCKRPEEFPHFKLGRLLVKQHEHPPSTILD